MQYDLVHFKNHSIDPSTLLRRHPNYTPIIWDHDWVIVVTESQDIRELNDWMKNNATAQYDVVKCGESFYVAFEDATDAVCFELSNL